MNELRNLADALRRRITGLRKVADDCADATDRFALHVRADEVTRCVAAIEVVLQKNKGGGNG